MKDKITKDMIAAMKAKETLKLGVLRAVKTAITNQEKASKVKNLEEDLVLNIIRKQIKQRQESRDMYINGERPELAQTESIEIEILEKYLPKQMDSAEVTRVVNEIVIKVGAASRKDMGKVMGATQKIICGRFDNKELSKIVMDALS